MNERKAKTLVFVDEGDRAFMIVCEDGKEFERWEISPSLIRKASIETFEIRNKLDTVRAG